MFWNNAQNLNVSFLFAVHCKDDIEDVDDQTYVMFVTIVVCSFYVAIVEKPHLKITFHNSVETTDMRIKHDNFHAR